MVNMVKGKEESRENVFGAAKQLWSGQENNEQGLGRALDPCANGAWLSN